MIFHGIIEYRQWSSASSSTLATMSFKKLDRLDFGQEGHVIWSIYNCSRAIQESSLLDQGDRLIAMAMNSILPLQKYSARPALDSKSQAS